jgi:hypothetical protein
VLVVALDGHQQVRHPEAHGGALFLFLLLAPGVGLAAFALGPALAGQGLEELAGLGKVVLELQGRGDLVPGALAVAQAQQGVARAR